MDCSKMETLALLDVATLAIKDKEYGSSWKKRGGVGAFMMLARKWDRLEVAARQKDWDIFEACVMDGRTEGVLDDIRDLRRYLLLVEDQVLQELEVIAQGMAGDRERRNDAADIVPTEERVAGSIRPT